MKFTIEYYPQSGFYYARRGWFYLRKDYWTGIVGFSISDWIFKSSMIWATQCKSRAEAQKLIDLYKEQKFKKTVIKNPHA